MALASPWLGELAIWRVLGTNDFVIPFINMKAVIFCHDCLNVGKILTCFPRKGFRRIIASRSYFAMIGEHILTSDLWLCYTELVEADLFWQSHRSQL